MRVEHRTRFRQFVSNCRSDKTYKQILVKGFVRVHPTEFIHFVCHVKACAVVVPTVYYFSARANE